MLIKPNKHDAIRAINDRFAATADHRRGGSLCSYRRSYQVWRVGPNARTRINENRWVL